MEAEKSKTYFIVTFRDLENTEKPQNITLKVKKISDSSLGLGFISLSGFLFSQNKSIIDPQEERRRERYENTKALHISLYHIISIEEVGLEQSGLNFVHDKSNVFIFQPNTKS